MADPGRNYVVYSMDGHAAELDLSRDGNVYRVSWLDSSTGELKEGARAKGGGFVRLAPPPQAAKRPWVAWLSKAR
jgi:hypothetical protein